MQKLTKFIATGLGLTCLILMTTPAGARPKTGAIRAVEGSKKCEGPQVAPKFGGSFCENLAYVQANIQPLENAPSLLGESRVVFFGDTHPNVLLKTWLAQNMVRFKKAGVTHVGLEFLNSESQVLLDAYRNNSALRGQVLQLVAQDWGWIPEAHVQVIDAAFAAGLQVLALDNRNELDRAGRGNDIQLRNQHMAKIINQTLEESGGGRMVVLTGKLHSALTSDEAGIHTIPEILMAQGLHVQSFDLESGEELVPKLITQSFQQALNAGALPASSSGDYLLTTAPAVSGVHGIVFIGR